MARRPALGGFSLNLFGGGGVSESVFSIASQGKQNEAYLALTRVEVQWEGGKVSNADYLAALATYVGTFPADSAERLNQQSRLESTTYRIERNVLVAEIEAGKKEIGDLLAYDQSKIIGLNEGSQEFLDRVNRLYTTQRQVLADEEESVVKKYGEGKMTTAQLRAWYEQKAEDPRFGGNTELQKQIDDRIGELGDRIVDERDAIMVNDYANGKVTPEQFLSYAGLARGRYADGTTQAREWDQRIENARDAAVEDDLVYRYTLSQDYLRLSQFVQSSTGLAGGTSTSTSTRTILGADGKWKTVTSTSTKPTKPSASEVNAYKKRQIEVAEAKKQMAAIASKLSGLAGGFIQSSEMLGYYKKQLGTVEKNTQEWYALQGRIDGINDAISAEKVMSRQGLKISYPKISSEKPEKYGMPGAATGASTAAKSSSSSPTSTGGGSTGGGTSSSSSGLTLEKFMAAIAKVESGGRYDARNKTTGAYGKYQILPSNWASYAKNAGLPAGAKPTPENQEKVALYAFTKYYKKYDGDWSRMAAAWHAGVAGTKGGPGTGNWGPKTRNYVSKVLSVAGSSYNPGRVSGSTPQPSGSPRPATGGAATPAAPGTPAKEPAKGTTLKVITGYTDLRRTSQQMPTLAGIGGFPTGLDQSQFKKIYASIEDAFHDGASTVTVDVGGGNVMQLFIGDDPDERIEMMRMLDDMNIDLAQEELRRYAGTPSEATKSEAALKARREAAGHEVVILDFQASGSARAGKSNPIVAGIRALDTIVAGIASETKLMTDAYDRGDYTAAYLHSQALIKLEEGALVKGQRVGGMSELQGYVALADAAIRKQLGGTGLNLDQLLEGSGTSGTELKKDLERLSPENIAAEVAKAAGTGEEVSTNLFNQLKRDGNGDVMFDRPGSRGSVMLKDNLVRVIKGSGKVVVELAKEGITKEGTKGYMPPDKHAPVVVKTGQGSTTAYAPWTIEEVGQVIMPGGERVPLMGKVISVPVDANGDGTYEGRSTYFENPLTPGKWSNSPIVYNAPKGTTVVYRSGSATAKEAFLFGGGGQADYVLQLDDKSGTYSVWKEDKGSFLDPAEEPRQLAANDPEALQNIGSWIRDLSNVPPDQRVLSDLKAPALGYTAKEWSMSRFADIAYNIGDLVNAVTAIRKAQGTSGAATGLAANIDRLQGREGRQLQQLVAQQRKQEQGIAPVPQPARTAQEDGGRLRGLRDIDYPGLPAPAPIRPQTGTPVTIKQPVVPKRGTEKAATGRSAALNKAKKPAPKTITPLPTKKGVTPVGTGKVANLTRLLD